VNNQTGGNPDPMFRGADGAGTLPKGFPFSDSEIISGTVSISAVLGWYRHVYAPRSGSPLIGAANDGGDIGAVSHNQPIVAIGNHAPVVNAGAPQTVYTTCVDPGFGIYPGCVPKRAFLQGQITDDGIQSQDPTAAWALVSAPSSCSPASACITGSGMGWPNSQFPYVDLRDPGDYVFRLTSSDGIAAPVSGDVTVTLSSSVSGPPPTSTASCDVNGDGIVNVSDVMLDIQMFLGGAQFNTRGDVDQDGVISVVDVQRLINAALGGGCRIGP